MFTSMKFFSAAVAAAALAIGGVAAAASYQVASAPAQDESSPVVADVVPAPEVKVEVKYRPCKKPARLEGKKCVTHEVRVVAPAPVVGSVSGSGSSNTPHKARHHDGDDDHEGYEDHDDDHEGSDD